MEGGCHVAGRRLMVVPTDGRSGDQDSLGLTDGLFSIIAANNVVDPYASIIDHSNPYSWIERGKRGEGRGGKEKRGGGS